MSVDAINPQDLGPASGFSHGQLGREGGRVLFVAGQIGVTDGVTPAVMNEGAFVDQFAEALRRYCAWSKTRRVVGETSAA